MVPDCGAADDAFRVSALADDFGEQLSVRCPCYQQKLSIFSMECQFWFDLTFPVFPPYTSLAVAQGTALACDAKPRAATLSCGRRAANSGEAHMGNAFHLCAYSRVSILFE